MRQHANFSVRAAGIRLDAIDQRRASRRGGEEALQDDQRRAMQRDRFERLERLRVGKSQRVAANRRALFERGQEIA